MKKLLYAWIEQVFSFDSSEEQAEYIEKQTALAKLKKQAAPSVIQKGIGEDGRYTLRIHKPYNTNPMLTNE